MSRKRNPHLLMSGGPKRPFKDPEEAARVAKEIEEKEGGKVKLNHYRCPSCPFWHVGRARKFEQRVQRPRIDMVDLIELGERAMGCLRQENLGPTKERLASIKQRTNTILMRRLVGESPDGSRRPQRVRYWAGITP